jgi:four helix bundle protein
MEEGKYPLKPSDGAWASENGYGLGAGGCSACYGTALRAAGIKSAACFATLYSMGDFTKLDVWSESQTLAAMVYKISARFPSSERFGLTHQVRRASVSVSSNIAEGAGRGAPRSFHGFLRIARGSLHEVRSQLHLAVRLGFVGSAAAQPVLDHADRVSRMLSGILRSERAK